MLPSLMVRNQGGPPASASRLWLLSLVLALVPKVAADDDGNDFTNNILTDLAPLLSLFGERVAQQFLSQSVGRIDCILFAVGPLGIITAIVSAIRCGGPPMLNAIIGRGREGRGIVEMELLSSTSEDVAELWNGNSIVRVLGKADVLQLVYVDPAVKDDTVERSTRHDETDLERISLVDKSTDVEIYEFTQAVNGGIISSAQEKTSRSTPSHAASNFVCPNISLNVGGQKSSDFERYSITALGIFLQLGVITYAGAGGYSQGRKKDFLHDKERMPGYAFPLMAGGTLIMAAGLYLCARVIDHCTSEEEWVVPAHEKRSLRLAWLQKGGNVNDQHFDSYLIRPHGRPLVANKESHRSRFNTLFKFRQRPRQFIITSRRSGRKQYTRTWLATAASLIGYTAYFFGLRFSHYSVTLVQLGVTVIMTGMRAFVRRSMIREPDSQEVAPGYELEWMAKEVSGCKLWNPVSRAFQNSEVKMNGTLATKVLKARRRLGGLVQWRHGNDYEQTIGAIANAIDMTMSVFSSRRMNAELGETDFKSSWDELSRFEWKMLVEVEDSDSTRLEEIVLLVTRKMDSISETRERSWGPWTTSIEDLGCFLRLWIMELHTRGRPAKGIDPFSTEGTVQNLLIFTTDKESNNYLNEDYPFSREPDSTATLFSRNDAQRSKPPHTIVALPCQLKCTRSINWLGYLSNTPAEKLCGQFIVNQLIFTLACGEGFHNSNCKTGELTNELRDDLINVLTKKLATAKEAYLCVSEALNMARESLVPMSTAPSDSISTTLKNNHGEQNNYRTLTQSDSPENLDAESWTDVDWCIWLNSAGALESLWSRREETNDKQNLLTKACQIGRSDMARFAVGLGADIHADKDCALLMAAHGGHEAVVWLLFDCGADIHARNDGALLMAAEGGHEGMVRLLLDRGADIHAVNDYTLRKAAERGHEAVVRLLLDRGADIHAVNDYTLREAAKRGHEGMVRLLLDRGANIHTDDDEALLRAAERGHEAMFRLLLDRGGPIYNDEDDVLGSAAQRGQEAMVRLLLDRGAEIHAGNDDALHKAVRGGHEGMVRLLLDRGANIHAVNDEALRWAAEIGHEAMVRLLLDRGAKIHAENDYALRWAAQRGHEAVVRLLLDRGANIHADNDEALRTAAARGHETVVRLLLDRGADIHADNDEALRTAAQRGHEAVVCLLLDRGADIHVENDYALRTAAERGHKAVVCLLLDHGADIHVINDGSLRRAAQGGYGAVVWSLFNHSTDWSALRWAAQGGYEKIVRLLLHCGANIHAENNDALRTAAKRGHETVVRLLLDRGADIHADNDEALRIAAERGYEAVVRLLLDRGADIHADNDYSLRWAAREGHQAVVRLLLDRGADIHADNDDVLRKAAERGHEAVIRLLVDHGLA